MYDHHHHHHDHQFGDYPSQSVMSYSDLSLMGSSAYGAPSSLLQMLNPNSNFPEEVPVDSGSGAILYNSTAFSSVDFANKGYMQVMEMPPQSQLGEMRKRKKGASSNYNVRELVDHHHHELIFEGSAGSNKNEKKRRERLSKKYQDLKALLPNSTKHDRATIIADSIDYINELLRTLNELNMLVDMKRRRREAGARKFETDVDGLDMESTCSLMINPSSNNVVKGSTLLRSSWLQRRSKETNVDVRIVEDEVFVKLTQHKRIDCMLAVSRVLDELDLDLLHLSGGNMGDSHIFMINAKIHEGSSVYACAIAKKIIEGMKIKYPLLCVNF